MKIVLLRPPTLLRIVSLTVKPSPPLGLAFIAAALRKEGHQVMVIDAIAEKADQYIPFVEDIVSNGLSIEEIISRIPIDTDVLGVSVMYTNNWLSDRKIIDAIGEKLPRIKIIIGGEHATGLPKVCLAHTRHLDACVMGEGEETVVELVRAFENNEPLRSVEGIVFRDEDGQIVATPRRKRIRAIEEIEWPAWDLFPLDIYKESGIVFGVDRNVKSLPILATRGCPYECTFCSSPNMWGTRYYMRPTDDVLDEIKYMREKYGATNFDFYDLTAIINRRWIMELTQKMIDQNLNITWQLPSGTRSEVIDMEVSRQLNLTGCKNVSYAPESGSQRILDIIKKRVSLPKLFESIRHSSNEGLNVKINIIIGFPEETHRDIWKTVVFLMKAAYYGVNDAFPSAFQPYTGCEQFETLTKAGMIKPETDEYYYGIIDADSFFSGHFYNENVSEFWIRTYRVFYLMVFYGTSWICRPSRFYKLIRNIATKNFESRSEMTLYTLVTRPFKKPVNNLIDIKQPLGA